MSRKKSKEKISAVILGICYSYNKIISQNNNPNNIKKLLISMHLKKRRQVW